MVDQNKQRERVQAAPEQVPDVKWIRALLGRATKTIEGDFTAIAALQIELINRIPGMPQNAPRPIDGPVAKKMTQIETLFVDFVKKVSTSPNPERFADYVANAIYDIMSVWYLSSDTTPSK